jgi:cytochrome b
VPTWDWPHRLWHWCLAAALGVSLYTGLADDLDLMDLHMTVGGGVLGLLAFRLGWGIWGGRYTRFARYRFSPAGIWRHFTGHPGPAQPHSAPGMAMAITLLGAVTVQAATGLFSSDDIFTDGPFVDYLSDRGVDLATAIHTRVCWLVLALICIHLLAIVWYAVRRDALAQSMFHGRLPGNHTAIGAQLIGRALLTAIGAGALVWAGARWL